MSAAASFVEFRSGPSGPVAEVSYPKRIVTCVAMPYEQPTMIHEQTRSYQEIVSRSAFTGIETSPGKVRANRDHDPHRLVGGAVAFHPSRSEGLVAELKISKTALGDDTLELARDGWLAASAGFGLLRQNGGDGPVYDDAEVWEERGTLRRLNRLYLDHVALVPNPAYHDAVVVDVRDTLVRPQEPLSQPATPNLDQVGVSAWLALEADLNKRYTR